MKSAIITESSIDNRPTTINVAKDGDLTLPLFQHYNICDSPLIAAIHDKNLDQASNLELFRQLSKAKKYNQDKLNVHLYKNGKGSLCYEHMSPLSHAVIYAIPAVVRILLENNPDIQSIDSEVSALHRAMQRGNLDIVKLLLEFGADPHNLTSAKQWTPLHYAQDAECTRWFIEHIEAQNSKEIRINFDAFINAPDKEANTPLHLITNSLVTYSAHSSYNTLNNAAQTSQNILQLLQVFIDKKANLNAVNIYGYTPLHCALMLYHDYDYDNIHFPTIIGKVKLLCEASAKVNIISYDKNAKIHQSSKEHPFPLMTPLLTLYHNYYLPQKHVLKSPDEDSYIYQIAAILLGKGALVNVYDGEFLTPLHKAALAGSAKTVELLLRNGANPNMRMNNEKPTPLHLCFSEMQNNKVTREQKMCLEHLLHAGANPTLSIHNTINLCHRIFSTQSSIKTITPTLLLILEQDNAFSRQAAILEMQDKDEPIDARCLRIWSSLGVDKLPIRLSMNPWQYGRFPAPTKGTLQFYLSKCLFNRWLDFFISNDNKAILRVLCLSPIWVKTPKDLIALFAANFISDPVQIKRLRDWIIAGRQSAKTQLLLNELKQTPITEHSDRHLRFFAANNRMQSPLNEEPIIDIQDSHDRGFG